MRRKTKMVTLGRVHFGHVFTSYTNDDLTISFAQDNEGTLLGFVYETEETKGEVTFTEDSVSEKITTVS